MFFYFIFFIFDSYLLLCVCICSCIHHFTSTGKQLDRHNFPQFSHVFNFLCLPLNIIIPSMIKTFRLSIWRTLPSSIFTALHLTFQREEKNKAIAQNRCVEIQWYTSLLLPENGFPFIFSVTFFSVCIWFIWAKCKQNESMWKFICKINQPLYYYAAIHLNLNGKQGAVIRNVMSPFLFQSIEKERECNLIVSFFEMNIHFTCAL